MFMYFFLFSVGGFSSDFGPNQSEPINLRDTKGFVQKHSTRNNVHTLVVQLTVGDLHESL